MSHPVQAIRAAGGISEANSDEKGFMKIHWMRAARTDKGVSAVGQVRWGLGLWRSSRPAWRREPCQRGALPCP